MAEKKEVKKTGSTRKTNGSKKVEKKVKKEVKKVEKVVKRSKQDYIDIINWKKWEAHNMDWLYIEINALDLLTEVEAGINNIRVVSAAILDCMLEGDRFIFEPKTKTKASEKLTVRYYCDNLDESRRKYFEVISF